MIRTYKELFSVRGYEVDSSNHATVQTLCGYMQESAGNHAAKLGLSMDSFQSRGITWALARLQIAVSDLPLSGEQVEVETWPVSMERLLFRRDFRIRRQDGHILARAISHWVVINLATRRLERMQGLINAENMITPQEAMEDSGLRLSGLEPERETISFKVRLSDIDRNSHVNNARYLEWLCESVPPETRNAAALSYVELAFKAESVYGDEVAVRCASLGTQKQPADDPRQTFLHSLHRVSDQKELVRACSVWKTF